MNETEKEGYYIFETQNKNIIELEFVWFLLDIRFQFIYPSINLFV